MSTPTSRNHPAFTDLLDYWFGDTDDATTERIDAHLFACDACGAQIDRLAGMARALRDAFAAGQLSAVVSPDFVERLVEQGLRVREYRVQRNGSVNCSVGADDDVVVGRLQLPLDGVQRLDVASDLSLGGDTHWLRDIPFDASRGEIVLMARIAELRGRPAHEMHVRVLSVDAQQAHEIGRFTFRHTPAATS
ncbi:zf-HC2 domain-containing protein [Denitromonas iodatirespirans]|uniref:Zf-HC2 domain-containing protein n=1 Tax=Denitromonas iodatirespirans TaxID=2795389 RepID=A0A944D7C9_DENI1|nr:zf-HC2 domain-containing protein [Denitromonas iodatirespirans]MBT0961304.1 zf-HC2 domain-containing protein [Denitromonas iodatirespirans]